MDQNFLLHWPLNISKIKSYEMFSLYQTGSSNYELLLKSPPLWAKCRLHAACTHPGRRSAGVASKAPRRFCCTGARCRGTVWPMTFGLGKKGYLYCMARDTQIFCGRYFLCWGILLPQTGAGHHEHHDLCILFNNYVVNNNYNIENHSYKI